jgi:hypothetical protein
MRDRQQNRACLLCEATLHTSWGQAQPIPVKNSPLASTPTMSQAQQFVWTIPYWYTQGHWNRHDGPLALSNQSLRRRSAQTSPQPRTPPVGAPLGACNKQSKTLVYESSHILDALHKGACACGSRRCRQEWAGGAARAQAWALPIGAAVGAGDPAACDRGLRMNTA